MLYDFVVHKQKWPAYSSWYIFQKEGKGMIRVMLERSDPNCVTITDFFVEESARNQGIGTHLIQYVIDWISTAGELDIVAYGVTKWSKPILEKAGFENVYKRMYRWYVRKNKKN